MNLLRLLGIILLGFALEACDRRPPAVPGPAREQEIKEGMARARLGTEGFILILQSGKASDCQVLLQVEDHGKTELIWLRDLTYMDGKFSGIPINAPSIVGNVKDGERIEVRKEDICDWMYSEGDKTYGNFTWVDVEP